ncbi:MAG: serine/threonine protein kinase [Deltaproteobacteria bacterium]|nr:serine/threonine protein kinase [Deltaproteobacteria bacterium]
MLGALALRELDATHHAQVTAHIDVCDPCRLALVAAVRAGRVGDVRGFGRGTPHVEPAETPTPDAYVGTRVGRYEIRRMLGAGGMGRVYEAFDPELDRAIALKVIRPELAGHASFAERLVRESRMMAKLVHPSVITVHDVGRFEHAVFIAMELIRGDTLGGHVRTLGAERHWRAIVGLLERAGQGLAAAHAAGIVHRDFKPDNVLARSSLTRSTTGRSSPRSSMTSRTSPMRPPSRRAPTMPSSRRR